jgi:hypothetical protein
MHPDYAPPHKNEVIGDNKCRGTHRNFSSELQCGPIFNKNGKASCFTFEQILQSLIRMNPMYSLPIINHSDGILSSQVPLKDEHGNNFCTKINLLDKYSLEEKRKEYELRTHVMKWDFIDAHHVGYDEYIALLYGKNPQTYWHPLIKDAYAMAMSYFKERGTNKFIDLLFVNITHFSAVMQPQDHETLVETDVSVGTLPQGYIRNVPLPRVPRGQSAKSHIQVTTIPDYYETPFVVPTYDSPRSLVESAAYAFSPVWHAIAINT